VIFMPKPTDNTPAAVAVGEDRDELCLRHLLADARAAVEAGVLEGDPMLVSIGLWSAVQGITSLLIPKPGPRGRTSMA